MEIKTPLFIFNTKYTFQQNSNINEYQQIDFASTLSCLFNVNVPVHNEGVAFISHFTSTDKRLDNKFAFRCLVNNLVQLNDYFHLTKDHDVDKNLMHMFNRSEFKGNDESFRTLSTNIENILRSISIENMNKSHSRNGDLLVQQLALLSMGFVRSFCCNIYDEKNFRYCERHILLVALPFT
jgi:hypothetical protein